MKKKKKAASQNQGKAKNKPAEKRPDTTDQKQIAAIEKPNELPSDDNSQVQTVDVSKKTFKEKIRSFFSKNWYLFVAFAIPALLFWMIYICMGVYPFGGNSVLVLDLNGQYVYFFEALHNAIRGDASLIYSWARSLGGEFIGIYAYYLASPLSYLVALFPSNHITEALLIMIVAKAGISGATMTFYLKKRRPNAHIVGIMTMSTMYALSSYVTAYAHNTMWMDALMLLPLTIYGVEELVKKGHFKTYIICLTLTIVSNFYIGWMTCIFLFLYFFYYYFSSNVNYRDNNYFGEKLHFIKTLFRMGIASVTSILISAFIVLPTYYSLTFGKTTFSQTNWDMKSQFDLIKMLVKLLPGSYDTVRPDGLPFIYCGVLVLLLLPVFFISRKVSSKEKIGAAIMLAIMVFCMNNSVIDVVFHGLQRPNWLNYRYSFMLIFILVTCCARGLEEIGSVGLGPIIGSAIGSIGLVVLVQTQKYEFIDDFLCIWISIGFIIAEAAALGVVNTVTFKKLATKTAYVGLACVCSIELFVSGILVVVAEDNDVVYSSRTGYVTYMNRVTPTVDYIQTNDKSFYRMEKTVFRNVCDNMALNMRGISNSTSTLNASVIEYLNRMGYSSTSHWSKYIGGTPVNDSLLGIKYIITDSTTMMPDIYKLYSNDPENTLYSFLNEYALSVAFASSANILETDISDPVEYASPFYTMNRIITDLLGEEETVELFKEIKFDLSYHGVSCTYRQQVYETRVDKEGVEHKLAIPYFFYEPDEVDGCLRYTLKYPDDYKAGSSVYFFFCSNYPRKARWSFSGDEEVVSGTVFASETDCIQSLGKPSGDYANTFDLTIDNDSNIFYVMQNPGIFYYLDSDVFTEVFEKLAKGNFVITDYTESRLEGTINASEGQNAVFTSIPYDEGWNVFVDGEKVETVETLDCLMAFKITPGNHNVKMYYRSSYMVYGLILSVAGIIIFAIMIIIEHFLIRPKEAERRECCEAEIENRRLQEEEKEAKKESEDDQKKDVPKKK
ncbi:MAG: YfhO family protein [Clostridia bacterium]|nr:YfhO family protein [Clostridia bacterium]